MADKKELEQLKNIELIESWAKKDINEKAAKSRERLNSLWDSNAFEEQLRRQAEEREKARAEHYSKKAERLGADILVSHGNGESGVITVYKARAALKVRKEKAARKESFIHRTYRLVKGLFAARKEIKEAQILTEEQKSAKYAAVFTDAWQPLTDGLADAAETLWSFLTAIGQDLLDILLFIADLVITAAYYIGSFFLYLWDVLWDLRIWFEEHKYTVFQYFSATVAVVAITLIGIASMSGYEYSYYGRTLGITRSRQEVYHTIEALGDKLSEASGANISLDVERDIKFSRIYGFNLKIDTEEDILNTLTYMKDIQVRAFAVAINGRSTVILESEDSANFVLDSIKNDYAAPQEGVEYTQVGFDQNVAVEEVGVQLSSIWNPLDAVSYLKTGSVKLLEEGEEAKPLVSLRALATVTTLEDINFGTKYIENPSLYKDEVELITAGVPGKTKVVSEVTTLNGEVVASKVASRERVQNPVDAVYYKGTKPLPERKGTGSFQYPLKTYTLTSRYGSRNTGIIGASRFHEGVDMAAPQGTKIYAADGGVVSFAGWRPGYGYVVIIDHGGLFESRYAHCNKLLVSAGEAVYKDQNIALVGSTGVSSGAHLHFEIRYKGESMNPLGYLP